MNDYQLYIDGDFCEASDGGRFDSTNPATGEVWASAPAATEADVDRAVRAAHRAMTSGEWASMTATARGRLLYRLADLVAENSHRLGEVETTDSGKLAAETRAQSAYVADYYRYYAGLADKIQGDTLPIDKPDLHVFTTRDPIGVVAAIVPWNAELFLTATRSDLPWPPATPSSSRPRRSPRCPCWSSPGCSTRWASPRVSSTCSAGSANPAAGR